MATVAVVMAASGCAAAAPEPGTANLDRANVQIELPADSYGMDWREAYTVQRAIELASDACAKQAGGRNWAAEAYSAEPRAVPEWRYGFWNADYVAKYGIEGKPAPDSATAAMAKANQAVDKDPDLVATLATCEAETDLQIIDGHHPADGDAPSPVFAVDDDSYAKTLKDTRVKEIWNDVATCAQKAGVSISVGDGLPELEIGDDWTEEQVRKAAVAEASCADQLNATQRIADIEAGYQQEYIAEHEAEFQAVREQVDATLAKADEIIKNNG